MERRTGVVLIIFVTFCEAMMARAIEDFDTHYTKKIREFLLFIIHTSCTMVAFIIGNLAMTRPRRTHHNTITAPDETIHDDILLPPAYKSLASAPALGIKMV
ncbi:P11 [Mycoreovirus 1]|uniref:Uncharacterized protein VP11 n=1 Tax=Cryphonectria parasitica mycoreovirus 1 (strain 9B21) TaxID=230407 RepID=VP11_MYRV9|nr:P11 [Mycoreovirus 1]Q65YU5.1 RecName: Full=Uncharacterized protein VP11; Flags: Precursor [Cryphonectria parasitica mycoreovirus 1]BAD51421.1 P11 [Cryphonectria parasitica mycoreovirus 1]